MTNLKTKYGDWALITGASSGIGLEFAKQIAAGGMNVAVAARRKQRLEALTAEIERDYGVQTRVIEVDLTTDDYLETIKAQTVDLQIGMLVNNAGAATPGAFTKQPLADRQFTLKLNVSTPMELTHYFSKEMEKRGKGAVIFTGSTVGYTGSPFMANYAATKAFILYFGQALHV